MALEELEDSLIISFVCNRNESEHEAVYDMFEFWNFSPAENLDGLRECQEQPLRTSR